MHFCQIHITSVSMLTENFTKIQATVAETLQFSLGIIRQHPVAGCC